MKTNYTICKFWISVKKSPKDYFRILNSTPYDERNGFGFEEVVYSNDVIKANLVKKTPTYYYTWNEETNRKEKINIVFVKDIPVLMDFKNNLLLVTGNLSDINAFKECLRSLCWNNFIYDSLKMSPLDILKFFREENSVETINEVSITNFDYNGIMSGKFNVKNADVDSSSGYLLNCNYDIDKVAIGIQFQDDVIKLVFKNKGRFSLQGKEDNKSDFINFLCANIK